MKWPFVLSIALAVPIPAQAKIIIPTQLQQIQRAAASAGKDRGRYEHARSLCLSQGYEVPTYEERHPERARTTAKLKVDYPQFWQLGARQGIAAVDEMVSHRQGLELICHAIAAKRQ